MTSHTRRSGQIWQPVLWGLQDQLTSSSFRDQKQDKVDPLQVQGSWTSVPQRLLHI